MNDATMLRRSMSARMFSTITTILTVAIAVGLLTLILSVRAGGHGAFTRGTGNVQMLISRDSSPLSSVLNTMFYAEPPASPIAWDEYTGLVDAYPFAWSVPTQIGDSYHGLPVVATTQAFFTAFQPVEGEYWSLAEGRVFERAFEVVLGADAARVTGLRIGDEIALTHGGVRGHGAHEHDEFHFTVVGILAPTRTVHDRALVTDLQSSWILHAHDRREDAFGHGIETTGEDVLSSDRKITGIYASLGERKAAVAQVLSAFRRNAQWTVAQPSDTVGKLFTIVSGVDQILVAMAGAVLLSSGVSIMVALYNSMEQRRRQIAVLRVLGASRGRVFHLVLGESAVLGLLGGVLGVGLGVLCSGVVAGALQRWVGVVIRPALPIEDYLWLVLLTTGLAMVAGIIPALVAYRTSVVRALRPMG